ncbi:hypothetical protein ABE137_08350 [Brevibacillus laterosporus]|uniref:hypothetical protein n=1 Tax=Brevibacillus laterosporus TaxID=1465 RepID=UPI003D1BB698
MRTRIGWMGFGLGIVFSAVFLLVFGQKAISIDELKQIAATQGWVVLSKEEFQRMQAQVPLKDQPQATPNTSKEKQSGQPAISAPTGQKQPEKKPDTAPTANSEKKKLASEHDKEATKASPSATEKQKMNESSKEKKKTEQSTEKSDKKTKENEKESNKTTQPAKGSSATTQQQAKDVSKQNHSSKENSEPSTSTTGEKEPAKKQGQSIEQTTNNKPGAEQKDTSGITQPVPPTPPEPPKTPVAESLSEHK